MPRSAPIPPNADFRKKRQALLENMRADRSRTRGHTVCLMNNKSVSTPAVAFVQPVNHTQAQPQPSSRTLKVALDVHLAQYTVAMPYDGRTPKPTQRFTPKNFLAWVEKQMAQGWRVITG